MFIFTGAFKSLYRHTDGVIDIEIRDIEHCAVRTEFIQLEQASRQFV